MRASPGVKNKTIERDGVRMSSVFRIAVLSGMALLWVIVAVLQYKWATQLSAATEVRIGSNLQSLMTRWHRDLYDELSAVCVALQVGPDSGAHDAWNDYLQRYAEWNRDEINSEVAEGAYPNSDLVREIYDWQTSAPGKPELLRLDPNTRTRNSAGVPQELEALLARLKANSSNLSAAKRAWEYGGSTENESGHRSNQLRTHGSRTDRKSTRLKSSHGYISYAVFCLKKKKRGDLSPVPCPSYPPAVHRSGSWRASVSRPDAVGDVALAETHRRS